MNTKRMLPVLVLLLISAACTTVDYQAPDLGARTADHRTVAVLPFEMVFTGKAPPGLEGEQILAIEEAESLAFQTSLYHRLLNQSSAHRDRPITIRIQPVEETRRLLAEEGIGIRESWWMPPEELAAVLGVDAVIRTRVEKTRYMSDLASYGVEVGTHVAHHVVHEATDGEIYVPIPWGLAKTHDIFADGSLLAGDDGDLLWKVAVHRATDWRRPANDVIEGLTKKLAKKFPYRAG